MDRWVVARRLAFVRFSQFRLVRCHRACLPYALLQPQPLLGPRQDQPLRLNLLRRGAQGPERVQLRPLELDLVLVVRDGVPVTMMSLCLTVRVSVLRFMYILTQSVDPSAPCQGRSVCVARPTWPQDGPRTRLVYIVSGARLPPAMRCLVESRLPSQSRGNIRWVDSSTDRDRRTSTWAPPRALMPRSRGETGR